MTFRSASSFAFAGILFGASILKVANGFYLPGVLPQSFSEGDEVKLKVNKVTSPKSLLAMDYYHFPFCQPEGGPQRDSENLGEFLSGDRIESSPYKLHMKEDINCEQLCVADLGDPIGARKNKKSFWKEMSRKEKRKFMEAKKRGEKIHPDINLVAEAVRRGYNNNWIVDNLPAATKMEDNDTVTTRFYRGFPIGFIGSDNRAYVNNHVNIEIMYHPVEHEGNKFRVVRFTVEPFSILHSFQETEITSQELYKIENPIASCSPGSEAHTTYDMVQNGFNQPASGKVLFTYDVTWIENSELKWASRWDVYLNMDDAIPAQIHWSSISNSVAIVLIMSTFIAGVLVRNLRKDISKYNKLPTDEEKAEEMDELGWKLVHADVFRPPSFSPLLLSVASGTGLQLLGMATITIILAALGFLNPSFRGSLLMALIFLYALMGIVSGYTTARLYKTFKGKSWQFATGCVAVFYPGLCFFVFFFLDVVAWYHNSTDAVPFFTMVILLLIWFGISSPLVFLGAYFGYKYDTIEFPVRTSSLARKIPEQPLYLHPIITIFVGACLPFGAAFVELYFIMSSMWLGQYYYVFGILMVVFTLLVVTCAEMSVLLVYLQLCAEDYNWWWRSFVTSGSVSIFVFIQSIHYFSLLEANTLSTYLLYFGYNGIICVGFFMMTGSIGLFSCLTFNRAIYSAIKVD